MSIVKQATWKAVWAIPLVALAPTSSGAQQGAQIEAAVSDIAVREFGPVASIDDLVTEKPAYVAVDETGSQRPIADLSCNAADIPTVRELATRQFSFDHGIYSRSQAVEAGFERFIGLNADANTRLLVIDYKRSDSCPTQDPKVSLVHGYTVRAIIRFAAQDAAASISIPFLAAQGTMANREQTISVVTMGVSNPKLTAAIQSIVGHDLNVENYSKFQAFLSGVVEIMSDPATVYEVRRIGRIQTPGYAVAVVTTFALDQIRRGRSCTRARDRELPESLEEYGDIVVTTYQHVTRKNCSADEPDKISKLSAENYLGGLQVRR